MYIAASTLMWTHWLASSDLLFFRPQGDGSPREGQGWQSTRLELKYGLTAAELLDAVNCAVSPQRLRLKEPSQSFRWPSTSSPSSDSIVDRFEMHDLDGKPDFSIWLPRRDKPLLAECKNIRESSKTGGEAYRKGGEIVAYKVETQKTRAATGDPTSRFYGFEQYHILGVCLGQEDRPIGRDLHVRSDSIDLARHTDAFSTSSPFSNEFLLPDAEESSTVGMLTSANC